MEASGSSAGIFSTVLRDDILRLLTDLRRMQPAVDPEFFPSTAASLQELIDAVDSEFGAADAGNGCPETRSARSWQLAVNHQKRQKLKLRGQLKRATADKQSGRIAALWFVRVGLADPCISAPVLAKFCRDFPEKERPQISKTYVTTVKDCFAELIKHHNLTIELADHIQALPLARTRDQKAETATVYLVHGQDEAAMRLRSFDEAVISGLRGGGSSRQRLLRGRSSKVQSNYLVAVCEGTDIEIYTELQPLNNKRADTIGAAIIMTVERVVDAMLLAGHSSCTQLRVVHLIGGDNIGTNQAAVRRVAHHFMRRLPVEGSMSVRYSVCEWPCAAHAGNLCVNEAICGQLIANASADKEPENNAICANASRLYRHLMPTYTEEFSLALKSYICTHLSIRIGDPAVRTTEQDAYRQLQALYGPGVLPDQLLEFFSSFKRLETTVMLRPGEQLADLRADLCGQAFHLLHKLLIVLESSPTPTRFWTFTECVNRMTMMVMLGLPVHILQLATTRPQPLNSVRLKRLLKFFGTDDTLQRLKEASLALQLTGIAVSISAQKEDSDKHRAPLLVRLGQGEVQRRTSEHLRSMISKLDTDADLDSVRAAVRLLNTEGSILQRYQIYSQYPTKLWELCSEFNPGYYQAIEKFLLLDERFLDAGFSVDLQRDAWAAGDDNEGGFPSEHEGERAITAGALEHMMSAETQKEITGVLRHGLGRNLVVERYHFLAMRHETKNQKVKSVSRASRDGILRAFGARRNKLISVTCKVDSSSQKALYMNYWALAVQRCAAAGNNNFLARPRGWLCQESEALPRELTTAWTTHGDKQALDKFVEEHFEQLFEDAAQIRRKAKEHIKKQSAGRTPYTNAEWISYIEKDTEYFQKRLQSATADRRAGSVRLDSPVLPALPRMRPERRGTLSGPLSKMQYCQPGFVAVVIDTVTHVLFMRRFRREMWAAEVPLRHDGPDEGRRAYGWKYFPLLSEEFLPLQDIPSLQACFGREAADDYHVASLPLEGVSLMPLNGDGLLFLFARARTLTPECIRRAKGKGRPRAARINTEISGSSDTEEVGVVEGGLSEAFTVVSDLGSDMGRDTEDEEAVSSEEECAAAGAVVPDGLAERLPRGTHVVFRNVFFYLVDNHSHPYLRMHMFRKWGITSLSKSIPRADYAGASESTLGHIVLRAWMLWRAHQHGFLNNRFRQGWHRVEASSLQTDIAALATSTNGSTGFPDADYYIKRWWPAALQL
jgi:hypothetical protein